MDRFKSLIGVEFELSPPVKTVAEIEAPTVSYTLKSDSEERVVLKIDRDGVIERKIITTKLSETKFVVEPAPMDLSLFFNFTHNIIIAGKKKLEFFFSTPFNFHLVMRVGNKSQILDTIYEHHLNRTWAGGVVEKGELCQYWEVEPHFNVESADEGTFYGVVPIIVKGDLGQLYELNYFIVEDDEFQIYLHNDNLYTNIINIDLDPNNKVNLILEDKTIFPDAELIRDIPLNKKGFRKILPEFMLKSKLF